eukprot:9734426-Karenia_brevis.AAC.1
MRSILLEHGLINMRAFASIQTSGVCRGSDELALFMFGMGQLLNLKQSTKPSIKSGSGNTSADGKGG